MGIKLLFGILAAAAAFRPAVGDDSTGAESPISQEAALASAAIRVPEGFTVSAVASEPTLANPVAFCFDPQGRIFVAETHRVHRGVEDNRNHMDWVDDDLAARTVEDRGAYVTRRAGDNLAHYTAHSDLVRLLEDRDRDGRYEHSSVFSTGYDNVVDGAAAGVLWVGDRLLFTCIPALWELRDADGDGQAEHQRSLASGFGVHFALFGHDLHGLIRGPDGKIYFSIGDRGLQVTTAEGRVLSNPDSGAVLRCNPDGSELELFATGLRNPQELAFNEFGDLFTVDNNSDSGDRARLVHIVEGMDAGWRMSYQYLPDRGPFNREKIWHTHSADQPASIVPPLAHLSDGPSGLVRYPGTGMPPEHDGAFLLADFRGAAANSGIREFWVQPHGASYRLARESMFVEGVLATDCEFGPDGALYISDWIEGWDGTGKGRIHRVASGDARTEKERASTQATLAAIPTLSVEELFPLLGHADMRVRLSAQQRLVPGGSDAAAGLQRIAVDATQNQSARLHAIWALGELGEQTPELMLKLAELATDDDAAVRGEVARTLGRAARGDEALRGRLGERLLPLLADDSPRVRSLAAIALGKLQHAPALAGLLAVCRENADRDPTLRHAAAMGLAGSQSPEAVIAAAAKAGESERLAIAVALGRQKSPLVAELLSDDSPRVRLEAARVIWDAPLPEAYGPLAAALDSVPSTDEPMLRRALAANVALRTPANLETVITCGLRTDLSPHIREHLWQLVVAWAEPVSRDPAHGLWRPLAPRPAEEVARTVQSSLPKIVAAGPTGALGVLAAAQLGVAEAYAPLATVAADEQHGGELRARALAALSEADDAVVAAAIDAGVNSAEPAVRTAARQLMIKRFPEQAAGRLVAAAESATTGERQAALLMLGQLDVPEAQAAIRHWFDLLAEDECPPELQLEVLEAAARSKDASLVERVSRWNEARVTQDAAAQFAASLHGGDAEQGGRVFEQNSALACRRCHSTEPGEKLVGPNLADAGARLSRSELLQSIVKPNEKITEGFQTTVLQLDTGKVVSGILHSEDDRQATLIDAEGKQIVVDAATIEGRFEGLSAMPEELMKLMTPRDLRDLVEFLSQQRHATGANSEDSGHGVGK